MLNQLKLWLNRLLIDADVHILSPHYSSDFVTRVVSASNIRQSTLAVEV
jgi:hypothetical protein